MRCNVALCSFSLKQFLKHFSTQAEAEAKEATLHATLFFYAFVTTINVLYVPLEGRESRRGSGGVHLTSPDEMFPALSPRFLHLLFFAGTKRGKGEEGEMWQENSLK